jgi:hypothetical protein
MKPEVDVIVPGAANFIDDALYRYARKEANAKPGGL